MPEPSRGLLDTSVVIDPPQGDQELRPPPAPLKGGPQAELAAGPHATSDEEERARRQDRLQWAAATWDPLPFDVEAARAYGRVFAAAKASGRSARSRFADLQIAATAAAHGLPLYTRNPGDFAGLETIVQVEAV